MRVLPAPGRERTRLIVLLGALAVTAAVWMWSGGELTSLFSTAAGPPMTSNTPGGQLAAPSPGAKPGARPGAGAGGGQTPQALKLEQVEQVPDEPAAGRNLFRFGARPVPKPPTPVYTPPPVLPPPQPTGPPPIPLRLQGLMDDPYGQKRAYLLDPSGAILEATEGQVVDGRYRLLKVGTTSVVMAYLDGTGQRTLTLGGR